MGLTPGVIKNGAKAASEAIGNGAKAVASSAKGLTKPARLGRIAVGSLAGAGAGGIAGIATGADEDSMKAMVLGGAVDGKAAERLLGKLKAYDAAVKMVTPYMYHNYIDALLKLGKKDEAHSLMRQYWGGMVENGADTFWELYNPENPDESPYGGTIVNSYCHAWSCGPAYFLRKFFK